MNTTILVSAVFLANIGINSAIKCFDCDSEYVTGCGQEDFDWYKAHSRTDCKYCEKVVGRSFMAKVLVSRRCVVSCTEGVDDTSEKKEHTYCCQTDLCNSAVTSINRLPAAVALFVAVKPIIMAIRLYK